MGKEFLIVSQDAAFEKKVIAASVGLAQTIELLHLKTPDDALAACASNAPAAAVFDVTSYSAEQTLLFFQKFRRMKPCSFVPLVAVCQKITPPFMHLSSEYLFFRVIEKESQEKNLRTTLSAVLAELERPSGLRMGFIKLAQAVAKGQHGEADRILEDLFAMYRDEVDVMVEYGNMCLRKGKLDRAQKVMEKLASPAFSAHSQNLRICNFQARVWLRQGNIGGALSVLDRANLLSPSNLERLTLMGDAFRFKGDLKKAEEKYLEVLRLDHENASGKRGAGLTALSQGESDRALEFFKGVCTEEEMGGFFNNTAVMAVKRQQFSKAQKLYEAAEGALESSQLKAKVAYNTGLLFRKWNRPNEAVESFRKAMKLDAAFQKAEAQLELLGASTFYAAGEPLLHDAGPNGSAAPVGRSALVSIQNAGRLNPEISEPENVLDGQAQGWGGDQDALIMDFADETLVASGGATIASSAENSVTGHKASSNIRTIDEPPPDVKPLSVKHLLASTKPKPKTAAAATSAKPASAKPPSAKPASAKGVAVATAKSKTGAKNGTGKQLKAPFIDDDEDDEAV